MTLAEAYTAQVRWLGQLIFGTRRLTPFRLAHIELLMRRRYAADWN